MNIIHRVLTDDETTEERRRRRLTWGIAAVTTGLCGLIADSVTTSALGLIFVLMRL